MALRTRIAVLAAFASFAAPGTAAAADPLIAAAGDIACASSNPTPTACQQHATSELLINGGYAKRQRQRYLQSAGFAAPAAPSAA